MLSFDTGRIREASAVSRRWPQRTASLFAAAAFMACHTVILCLAAVSTLTKLSRCVAAWGQWISDRAVFRVERALGQASRDRRLRWGKTTFGTESDKNVVRSH